MAVSAWRNDVSMTCDDVTARRNSVSVTCNDVTDVAVDRLFHLALNALSNNAVDRRWRDIRIGSYLTCGNVIGGRHSVLGGSTFRFVGEVKKGGRRSYSASRRSTNDERNQY
jgi:hypothetical protein